MEIHDTKVKWASPEIEAHYNDLCAKVREVMAEADRPDFPLEGRSERIDRAFKTTEVMRSEAVMLRARYSSPVVIARTADKGEKST